MLPQNRGKLTPEMSGGSWEVFAKVLRGLSGAKLTRPSQFRSQDEAFAVRCSYKVIYTPSLILSAQVSQCLYILCLYISCAWIFGG